MDIRVCGMDVHTKDGSSLIPSWNVYNDVWKSIYLNESS